MSTSKAHKFEEKWRSNDVRIHEEADFSSLLLSERVLQGLEKAGFKKPSPIQLEAIPTGRFGKDLVVQAKSGTGKTLVFTVIALEMLLDVKHPQVMILAPTREIAFQICDVICSVGCKIRNLKCCAFIGGIPVSEDIENIKGCQIIVGTPGRIKQLISLQVIQTNSIRLLVLDEADQLFEKSFKGDIDAIFLALPKDKQIISTSATYPSELKKLTNRYFRDAYYARLNANNIALLGTVHYIHIVPNSEMVLLEYKWKLKALENVLTAVNFSQSLVFCNFLSRVETLCYDIKKWGFTTTFISSAKEQSSRLKAIECLKRFKCKVLVTSDLTSRGIDAENVDLVINFDAPSYKDTYFHRVGRAGRYGSKGVAITLLTEKQKDSFHETISKGSFKYYTLPDPVPANLIDIHPSKTNSISEDDLNHNEDSDNTETETRLEGENKVDVESSSTEVATGSPDKPISININNAESLDNSDDCITNYEESSKSGLFLSTDEEFNSVEYGAALANEIQEESNFKSGATVENLNVQCNKTNKIENDNFSTVDQGKNLFSEKCASPDSKGDEDSKSEVTKENKSAEKVIVNTRIESVNHVRSLESLPVDKSSIEEKIPRNIENCEKQQTQTPISPLPSYSLSQCNQIDGTLVFHSAEIGVEGNGKLKTEQFVLKTENGKFISSEPNQTGDNNFKIPAKTSAVNCEDQVKKEQTILGVEISTPIPVDCSSMENCSIESDGVDIEKCGFLNSVKDSKKTSFSFDMPMQKENGEMLQNLKIAVLQYLNHKNKISCPNYNPNIEEKRSEMEKYVSCDDVSNFYASVCDFYTEVLTSYKSEFMCFSFGDLNSPKAAEEIVMDNNKIDIQIKSEENSNVDLETASNSYKSIYQPTAEEMDSSKNAYTYNNVNPYGTFINLPEAVGKIIHKPSPTSGSTSKSVPLDNSGSIHFSSSSVGNDCASSMLDAKDICVNTPKVVNTITSQSDCVIEDTPVQTLPSSSSEDSSTEENLTTSKSIHKKHPGIVGSSVERFSSTRKHDLKNKNMPGNSTHTMENFTQTSGSETSENSDEGKPECLPSKMQLQKDSISSDSASNMLNTKDVCSSILDAESTIYSQDDCAELISKPISSSNSNDKSCSSSSEEDLTTSKSIIKHIYKKHPAMRNSVIKSSTTRFEELENNGLKNKNMSDNSNHIQILKTLNETSGSESSEEEESETSDDEYSPKYLQAKKQLHKESLSSDDEEESTHPIQPFNSTTLQSSDESLTETSSSDYNSSFSGRKMQSNAKAACYEGRGGSSKLRQTASCRGTDHKSKLRCLNQSKHAKCAREVQPNSCCQPSGHACHDHHGENACKSVFCNQWYDLFQQQCQHIYYSSFSN